MNARWRPLTGPALLRWAILSPLLLWMLAGGTASADASRLPTRRFALIAGADDGGRTRVRLRYAATDAEAFSSVLTELGGVAKADRLLVADADGGALDRAFSLMETRMRAARGSAQRIEFLFYYSGHSDEQGLLLGNDVITYRELKARLDAMSADVKIGILDSCASGALVRLKGGRPTAPFLVDTSTDIEGYALLTSSSADENAQESERIGASYFTHYLISGMRGAADTNRDGRVTLSESYAYAFDETLYSTESSRGGAQHPNYDFQLAGTGDLVLTDLRATSAAIALARNLEGRVFIRDTRGRLVAEVNKSGAGSVEVALPPGVYEVTADNGRTLRRGKVTVARGRPTPVSAATLSDARREATTTRGNRPAEGDLVKKPAAATFVPAISTNGTRYAENRFAINFIGAGYNLRGFEAGLIASRRDNAVYGVQFAHLMNRTTDLTGAQIGAVNLTRGELKGVQLGLFNAAQNTERGAQIGLINFAADGRFSIGMWAQDAALLNTGVKMGGRHTYSVFGFGVRLEEDTRWVAPLLGFGGHFEIPGAPLFMEVDLVAHWLFTRFDEEELEHPPVDLLGTLRLAFGIRLFDRLSFFGGPLLNGLVSESGHSAALLPVLYSEQVRGYHVEISPGFMAGFQVEPPVGRMNRPTRR